MSQMATAIDNLRARLDGDPDLIALAKIFIPAYTRVKDGQTQNVDAHFREGRPGEKVMLKERAYGTELGEVVVQNDGSLYHTETGTTLADVPDGHDLVEMPKSVDEALEAGDTPDLDELVDDAQRVDVEAPESVGDVYEGTEDFLSQPFADGEQVGPQRSKRTMENYYGEWVGALPIGDNGMTALGTYINANFAEVNARLRDGGDVGTELDDILDSAPATPADTNLVTYRGVARTDGDSRINEILDAARTGDALGMAFSDPAYAATSLTDAEAQQYSRGDAVLRYRIPAGSQPGGYAGNAFLLKRDSEWTVARVEPPGEDGGPTRIDLVPRNLSAPDSVTPDDGPDPDPGTPDTPDEASDLPDHFPPLIEAANWNEGLAAVGDLERYAKAQGLNTPDVAVLLESAGEALLDDDYPTANLHMNSARDRMAADLRAEADFLSGIDFDSVDVPDPNPDGPEPSYPEGSDDPEDFEEYAYELRDWLRNEADWGEDLDPEWENEVMWAADVAQNEIGPDVVEAVAKVRNLIARARGEDVPFDPRVSGDVDRAKEEMSEFLLDDYVKGSLSDQYELRAIRSQLGNLDPEFVAQAYTDFQKFVARIRERQERERVEREEMFARIDARFPTPDFYVAGETDVADLGFRVDRPHYKDKSGVDNEYAQIETMDADYSAENWPQTAEQREGLRNYTGFSYVEINGELRGEPMPEGAETLPPESLDAYVRWVDGALAAAPPAPRKMTSYRGIKSHSDTAQKLVAAIEAGTLLDAVISDRAFMSSSMTPEVGSKFAQSHSGGGVVFRHHIPEGSKLGGWVRDVSRHKTENEFLFGRGQRWRVAKVSQFDGDEMAAGQTPYINDWVLDLVPIGPDDDEEGITVALSADDMAMDVPVEPSAEDEELGEVDATTGKMSPPESGRGLRVNGKEFADWDPEEDVA